MIEELYKLAYELYRKSEHKYAIDNNIEEYSVYNYNYFKHDKLVNNKFFKKAKMKYRKDKLNKLL